MIPDAWDIELRQGALDTARLLLETGCIRYDPDHPCRHASGLVSPMHVDTRPLLGDVAARRRVLDFAVRMIGQEIGDGAPDAIAAAEGAGVAFATLLADRLDRPLVFVRKDAPDAKPFKHRIEGRVEPGARVLLVEQLATDGHRKARFAEPLRAAGCDVRDVFVLFRYGIFDRIHENLAPLGLTVHALADWWDVLEAAERGGYLDAGALAEIRAYLHDPEHWTERRATAA
ncbi:orotate phosphoribosyltransferase [Azospirillum halopraeferens]|uniref:orotate phosphoribosyltransferase n=1 Tax=Azospirillum halopraeferens TaxID=34010 RepID=UPI000403456E|nr:orotate phosphoribosyltransferase [Azospirillum halopraeferens]